MVLQKNMITNLMNFDLNLINRVLVVQKSINANLRLKVNLRFSARSLKMFLIITVKIL